MNYFLVSIPSLIIFPIFSCWVTLEELQCFLHTLGDDGVSLRTVVIYYADHSHSLVTYNAVTSTALIRLKICNPFIFLSRILFASTHHPRQIWLFQFLRRPISPVSSCCAWPGVSYVERGITIFLHSLIESHEHFIPQLRIGHHWVGKAENGGGQLDLQFRT